MIRKTVNKTKVNFNLRRFKVYVLGAVCGSLTIACIFMTIETSTNGAEIAGLQNKEAQLMARQQDLQENLVQALSVNKLAEQSAQLGFIKATNLVYVTDAAPVAKLP